MDTKAKMFLFARWISISYADSHLDEAGKSENDRGFRSEEGISVLNRETGHWYKKQLDYFNKIVWPNYIENGSAKETRDFLEDENM